MNDRDAINRLRVALDALLHATMFKDHPRESQLAIEALKATGPREASHYSFSNLGEMWWCETHKREARAILHRPGLPDEHCCTPGKDGTMMPCRCVQMERAP